MRLVVLLFGIAACPQSVGDPLFLPISDAELSRLQLQYERFLYSNEHAVPGSIKYFRVNANALPKPDSIIEIPRDSGREQLRIRVNSVRPARRKVDGRKLAGELLHPKSDQTTQILMFIHEHRVDSLGDLPNFDLPDQEFVYSLSGSIPIRWESTILEIRPLSLTPGAVVILDIEPNRTTRDMEESNERAREWLRKHEN